MKIIQFVKNSGAYSPGDRAGFEDTQADAYVTRGDALHTGETTITGDGTGEVLPLADNTVKTGRKVRHAPEAA